MRAGYTSIVLLFCFVASSCSDGSHELIVDIQTSLTPGPEFDAFVVELYDERGMFGARLRRVEDSASAGDDFTAGHRAAELSEVESGFYVLLVSLRLAGEEVASQVEPVEVNGDRALTVVVGAPPIVPDSGMDGGIDAATDSGADSGADTSLTDARTDASPLPEPAIIAYVDGASGRDDPSACTDPSTPCATIGYAAATYADPSLGSLRVEVRGGTYGGVTIGAGASGTTAAPTHLRPWPDTGTPVVDLAGAGDFGVVFSPGVHHVVLEGFEVTQARVVGIHLAGNPGQPVEENVIRGCDVHDNGQGAGEMDQFDAGIMLLNVTRANVIEGNRVHDNRDDDPARRPDGITDASGPDNVIVDNVVTGNEGSGINVGSAASTVSRNTINRNGVSGISVFVSSAAGPVDYVIEDNAICNSGGAGLYLQTGGAVLVRHNAFVDNGDDGMSIGPVAATIERNVVTYNDAYGIEVEAGASITHRRNAYFGNASGAAGGLTLGPEDITEDPRVTATADCEVTVPADSSAAGLGPRE